jgi:hypothetical protein
MLKDFFNEMVRNDLDYFKFCLKHLLKEDVHLLTKHIKLKVH